MQKLTDVIPECRYLLVNERWSDDTIDEWKEKMIKRFSDKSKPDLFDSYLQWKPAENEVAVFSLYACADIPVPAMWDCIFDMNDPERYCHVSFTITQAVWEGWCPSDVIGDGHKHLLILSFNGQPPEILRELREGKAKYVKEQEVRLGLCRLEDLPHIGDRKRRYSVHLDGKRMGFSYFEHADVYMGVVFGELFFDVGVAGNTYAYWMHYCRCNGIEVPESDEELRFLQTRSIPCLTVYDLKGFELAGMGTDISGMDGDCFTITILGMDAQLLKASFPHHRSKFSDE